MLRTKAGIEGRSRDEVYRTPTKAIRALMPHLQLPRHVDSIVDLCAGDGRLGRAFAARVAEMQGMSSVPWIGCDIAPIGIGVLKRDVFAGLKGYAEIRESGSTLFVTNPPYGMDRDSNGLYLHDRILGAVADTWREGDQLIVLYPDLMFASKRRWEHITSCLGAPAYRYALTFRCAFERSDGSMASSAQSCISWYQWIAGRRVTQGSNLYLSGADDAQ